MNAALESRHARGQALTVLLGSLSTLGLLCWLSYLARIAVRWRSIRA